MASRVTSTYILGSEQRNDIVMKAFEKLKFKKMRKLARVQYVSEDEFNLKGENIGISLKYFKSKLLFSYRVME